MRRRRKHVVWIERATTAPVADAWLSWGLFGAGAALVLAAVAGG